MDGSQAGLLRYSVPYDTTKVSTDLYWRAGDADGTQQLTHISPVAWQHINFYGRYEFTTGASPIDIDALVARAVQRPIPGAGEGLEAG